MPRVSILFASLGLAFNVMLWTVPGIVSASSALQLALPRITPTLAQRVGTSSSSSTRDALIGLIGAEVEAMHVAGAAIDDPRTPRLAERANTAGARVLDAAQAYVNAVQAALRH